MSDPTIQTFCCHRAGNNAEMAVKIMNEFNSDSYNALCLVSSIVGIMGAIYQILPAHISKDNQRWLSFTSRRGRQIIIWLAVADLLASLGVLVRSISWLQFKNIMPMPEDEISVLFCAISSAWTQYFYTASWFWTLFYAVDTWRSLRGRDPLPLVYHSIAWGVPAATTSIGLSILYFPDATCHNVNSISTALFKILPNYCVTYVPIAIVMIVNPIMYVKASKVAEVAVSLPLAQFTSKERRVVDALRLKFFLINAAFYLCWVPNIINGVLVWTMWFNMPIKLIVTIWYIMAIMNPMQALLNAIVYRRWYSTGSSQVFSLLLKKKSMREKERDTDLDERSPLLSSAPQRLLSPMASTSSINNYATI